MNNFDWDQLISMTELEKLIRDHISLGTSDKDIIDEVASVLHTIKSEEKAKDEAKLAERAADMEIVANIFNKYITFPDGIEEKITAEDIDKSLASVNEFVKGIGSTFKDLKMLFKTDKDPLSKFLENNGLTN